MNNLAAQSDICWFLTLRTLVAYFVLAITSKIIIVDIFQLFIFLQVICLSLSSFIVYICPCMYFSSIYVFFIYGIDNP